MTALKQLKSRTAFESLRSPKLNPPPKTQNTKHKTQNTKHKTQNTKPKTPNPKPKTQNPKPKIQNPGGCGGRRGKEGSDCRNQRQGCCRGEEELLLEHMMCSRRFFRPEASPSRVSQAGPFRVMRRARPSLLLLLILVLLLFLLIPLLLLLSPTIFLSSPSPSVRRV